MVSGIEPRPTSPRIAPLEPEAWSDSMRRMFAPERKPAAYGKKDEPVFNVFKTMANFPEIVERMAAWGGHVLFKSSLSPREREMAILRTGWVCRCLYEFMHHRELALASADMTEEDVSRVQAGADAVGLDAHEAAILAATDELIRDHFIADATWQRLSERFSARQMADLVFCVGHYSMMCNALNSFGVQLEAKFASVASSSTGAPS
jgi:4-carboxymuconolactone decarboxylase